MSSDIQRLADHVRVVGSGSGDALPRLVAAVGSARWMRDSVPDSGAALSGRLDAAARSAQLAAQALRAFDSAAQDFADRLASGATTLSASPPGRASSASSGAGAANPWSVNAFPLDDDIRAFADRVPGKPGYYDVMAHGDSQLVQLRDPDTGQIQDVDARGAAAFVRSRPNYAGGPVRLLSCNAGASDDGLAQQLADELGEPVEGPTDLLWYHADGYLHVGGGKYDDSGTFRLFYPRGGS